MRAAEETESERISNETEKPVTYQINAAGKSNYASKTRRQLWSGDINL